MASKIETLIGGPYDDNPLNGLAALTVLRHDADGMETILVRRARNQGSSWAAIAGAMGVSKQAVHKKHGGSRFRD